MAWPASTVRDRRPPQSRLVGAVGRELWIASVSRPVVGAAFASQQREKRFSAAKEAGFSFIALAPNS